MRKIIKNKKGVSAVIGVILMISITIAMVLTVYIYATGMLKNDVSDSYDNLKLKDGYIITNVDYERIGATYKYFVNYEIQHANASCNCPIYLNGFLYDKTTDELFYFGNSEYVEEIIN